MKSINWMVSRIALMLGIGLLPLVAAGEVNVPLTDAGARMPPMAMSMRTARMPVSSERMDALLAEIPDDHPMREELRQVVRQGPPEGFTAEEWLRLAMKFNFRMPGSQRLRLSDSH